MPLFSDCRTYDGCIVFHSNLSNKNKIDFLPNEVCDIPISLDFSENKPTTATSMSFTSMPQTKSKLYTYSYGPTDTIHFENSDDNMNLNTTYIEPSKKQKKSPKNTIIIISCAISAVVVAGIVIGVIAWCKCRFDKIYS